MVVICAQCSKEWVFPVHTACPNCGDAIEFEPLQETEAVYNPRQANSDPNQSELASPKRRLHEPDGWAKGFVYIGLGLCLLLILFAWDERLLLAPVMKTIGLPLAFLPMARFGVFLLGAFGSFRAVITLLSWYSGWRFYRRYRFY